MTHPLPTLDDLEAARGRISRHAAITPLVENPALNDRTGGRVFLKCEPLQRTGSFKFRGAFNAISNLSQAERARGVVASSSGNHAQAVAATAQIYGVPAVIVMPSDAPAIKIARTKGYGAEVVLYERASHARDRIARDLCEQRGSVYIPPYEHPDVIAGQGTCGLEIVDQLTARGVTPDAALVCCSGGGLTAGVSTALTSHFPDVHMHSAEPDGFDDTKLSLQAGHRVAVNSPPMSICDALLVPEPGELTFEINRRLLASGVSVTDDEARAAVAFAFDHLKLVVEPGGAVALAAALFGKIETRGRTLVAVLSGGNIDRSLFREILADAEAS